ncbi:hypothetical protein C1H46_005736 [Malus baccata]|uniref:Branched-chain-amino-acid aminotransferase n=1 Tax=Malus baccata TaxID=106549 RepID=A0A540NC78_MALBA|nr:hypothetical protein C1H46_005736 [Malus baccata]
MESSPVLGGLQPNYLLCPSRNPSSSLPLRPFSFTSHSSPLSLKLQRQLPLTSHGAAAASPIGGYTTLSDSSETSELADIDWDNLGFAFLSTDYMYVMKCAQGGNFPKGELQSFGNIELSPSAGVLNYGQGLFEGLKAYRKEDGTILLFRPEENALRMRLGAERMCMPSPTVKQFVEAVKATVLANRRWDNVISTPAIKGTILPGITRKSIIEIARSEGFPVEERQVAVDELLDADEVFCTGTAVVVSPVGSITYLGKKVSYGEGGFGVVSEKLYSVLTRLQMGLSEDKMDWTVELG